MPGLPPIIHDPGLPIPQCGLSAEEAPPRMVLTFSGIIETATGITRPNETFICPQIAFVPTVYSFFQSSPPIRATYELHFGISPNFVSNISYRRIIGTLIFNSTQPETCKLNGVFDNDQEITEPPSFAFAGGTCTVSPG